MNVNNYLRKYFFIDSFSWAAAINKNRTLMTQLKEKRIVKCKGSPPFDKIKHYEVVKCGKIWVLLGKVLCNGQVLKYFEMMVSIDEAELEIYKDLHCIV